MSNRRKGIAENHLYQSPINYPSTKISCVKHLKTSTLRKFRLGFRGVYQLPVNYPAILPLSSVYPTNVALHAQNGRYFINFGGASFSNGLIPVDIFLSSQERLYRLYIKSLNFLDILYDSTSLMGKIHFFTMTQQFRNNFRTWMMVLIRQTKRYNKNV